MFSTASCYELDDPKFGKDWYGPDLITEWGLKFIDEAIAAKKPFFYYLPHSSAHFPLQVPKEDIDRYRGKYMVGWDKLREARHKRQIEMGLVDPKWPLTPRPPDVPAWDTVSDADKDRFDHIMAIYAAMIDRLDRSVGTLVEGLKKRGVLDNTLIMVMCRQRRQRRGGPARPARRRPARRPEIDRLPRPKLGHARQHAVLALQAFHARRRHLDAAHRPLARRHLRQSATASSSPSPATSSTSCRLSSNCAGAKYPSRISTATRFKPMEGVSLVPALAGKPIDRRIADFL